MAYCALHKREFSDTEPCPYCKAARERKREARLDRIWEDLRDYSLDTTRRLNVSKREPGNVSNLEHRGGTVSH
jgi:hypothetical protein